VARGESHHLGSEKEAFRRNAWKKNRKTAKLQAIFGSLGVIIERLSARGSSEVGGRCSRELLPRRQGSRGGEGSREKPEGGCNEAGKDRDKKKGRKRLAEDI